MMMMIIIIIIKLLKKVIDTLKLIIDVTGTNRYDTSWI